MNAIIDKLRKERGFHFGTQKPPPFLHSAFLVLLDLIYFIYFCLINKSVCVVTINKWLHFLCKHSFDIPQELLVRQSLPEQGCTDVFQAKDISLLEKSGVQIRKHKLISGWTSQAVTQLSNFTRSPPTS